MSKQNKPPKFHHYVPRTYLRHWLDDNDLMYIYNKRTGKVSPSSVNGQYFGKNQLNTITYPDSTKGYWVEAAFAELEGKITPVLKKIASSSLTDSSKITYEDKLMLSMFVSAQFWRLPANADFIKSQRKSGDVFNLGLSVIDRKSGQKMSLKDAGSFYEHISSTDLFQKAYPILMALLYTAHNSKYEHLQTWHFYFQSPGFHLTSDNPIMYTMTPTKDSIFNNFILPISPGVLLIATDKSLEEISPSMSNALNILQICHAHQFIAGKDEKYLREIADIYEQDFKTAPLDQVERYVYGEIFGNMS